MRYGISVKAFGRPWGWGCLRAFSFLRRVLQRLYPRFYLANLVSSLQSSGVFFSFQDPHSQLDDLVLSFSEDFFLTPLCVGGGPLVLCMFVFKFGQRLQQHIDLAGRDQRSPLPR